MRFTLWRLYKMNESKPFVRVTGIDDDIELQWDYCDLEGLPPKRTGFKFIISFTPGCPKSVVV